MPLSGIRVVDLTRILAGPFCTMLLADMGAEVIKIEPPGEGDPIRRQGVIVEGLSWYFAQFNRNKKSITLDLHAEEGKDIQARLIARADVLVENYRPGVLDRMGFGEARLRELNPGLVVCGVNGYGSTGPYADRPSFDFIAQAMSGFMSVNGRDGQEPMRAAMPISDVELAVGDATSRWLSPGLPEGAADQVRGGRLAGQAHAERRERVVHRVQDGAGGAGGACLGDALGLDRSGVADGVSRRWPGPRRRAAGARESVAVCEDPMTQRDMR